jgi:hypothetical protein
MYHTQPNSEYQKTELVSMLKMSLQNDYPEHMGWKMYNRYNWTSRNFDMILQKEEGEGEVYRVVVCVNLENSITKDEYRTVSKLARRLNHGTSIIMKKILVVDDKALVAKGPSDIEVVQIRKMINENVLSEPKLVA